MKLLPFSRSEIPGLVPLQRQMNRLFHDFFEDSDFLAPSLKEFAPPLDLAESEEAIVVKLEVPGIDPKSLDISILGDSLYVKGEKKTEKEEKGKTWHRVERSYGAFCRQVSLPSSVDPNRIEAQTKDGLLTITLPKVEQAKAKHIPVKT